MADATPTPNPQLASAPPRDRPRPRRRLLKLGVFFGVVAVGLALVWLTPLHRYLQNVRLLRETLAETGPWAPVSFFMVAAVLVLVGMPRLPLCGLGGAMFGFWEGFVLAQLSALAGSYGTFLVARWSGRDAIARWARLERFGKLTAEPTVVGVFLSRQLPISTVFISLFWGLTQVRHPVFLLGSLVGFLPEGAVVTLIGSGLVSGSLHHLLKEMLSAAALVLVGGLIVWKLVAKAKTAGKENGACPRS